MVTPKKTRHWQAYGKIWRETARDEQDVFLECIETGEKKEISPAACNRTFYEKFQCPKCGSWLGYEIDPDATCFHEPYPGVLVTPCENTSTTPKEPDATRKT